MKKVKKFVQIEPVVVNDGVRNVLSLFALDSTGALWQRVGNGPWVRVEQPEVSTADGESRTTEGV